ncbi:MAG: hypothetical protein JM58_09425 [Peptococcaceae bacterium BICA1-8]|nr:MAG: hypothetical protein JM58_09425 [Peptococcaceae bacterium BICA1-8]
MRKHCKVIAIALSLFLVVFFLTVSCSYKDDIRKASIQEIDESSDLIGPVLAERIYLYCIDFKPQGVDELLSNPKYNTGVSGIGPERIKDLKKKYK